jgi:hypothetical protein
VFGSRSFAEGGSRGIQKMNLSPSFTDIEDVIKDRPPEPNNDGNNVM